MVATVGLTPIPWKFIHSDVMKMWQWETPHFEARVTADVNSFAWEIYDLISRGGEPMFLVEGRTREFHESEMAIREMIGKSYPAKFGYASYAGALATTFTLATGERIDLGRFNGTRVVVTVRLPNGLNQSFIGLMTVVHYEVHLTPEAGTPVRIQPSHIVKIAGEGGTAAQDSSYTGIGRIYRGTPTRGCTGVPGFMPETIDHTGPTPCPMHEDTRQYG